MKALKKWDLLKRQNKSKGNALNMRFKTSVSDFIRDKENLSS
jgi:hypothetical protein